MTPVVVLNMHYSGLAIARDLAGRGIPVLGLSADRDLPGNRSRHVRFIESPDSLQQPDELAVFLEKLAQTLGDRPILFPTRDHDLLFINAQRDRLAPWFRIPFPEAALLEAAMDKDRCAAAAIEVGIRVPRGVTVHSRLALAAELAGLEFPVIAKPLMASHWRRPGIWEAVRKQKAIVCANPGDLRTLYDTVSSWEPRLTVQEYIPGPEESLCIFGSYTDRDGTIAGYFTGRKRLQFPRLRGTGIVVEACPISSIVEPSKRLLQRLRFFGVSEIEYKIHEATGVPHLIEINPRHWDQHGLGAACGVNISWLAYRDWAIGSDVPEGEPAPAAKAHASGMAQRDSSVTWIAETELLLEAARLLAFDRAGLSSLLKLVRGERTYAVLSMGDLGPAAAMMRNLARTLRSRVAARLRAALEAVKRSAGN
jgi:predicted ATP-grasp superfamily ATP-dependent carboligase